MPPPDFMAKKKIGVSKKKKKKASVKRQKSAPAQPKKVTAEVLAEDRPMGSSQSRPRLEAPKIDQNLPVVSDRSGLGALSSIEPLKQYLLEVQRYPMLDPAEEFRLAVKLRDDGDISAAKKLVSANLRLVVKIAFEYNNIYQNVMDLIQEGNIGLMKAVSKFDPAKGARLSYYASWWIKSYILKYIMDNFRLVKIGTTQSQKKLFYQLMREKERLEAQGLVAGPKLLAGNLNVSEKDIIEMGHRLSSGSEMSIDVPLGGVEGGSSFSEMLESDAISIDEDLAKKQLLALLEGRLPEFYKILDDREKKILDERLLSEDPKTLREVAEQYDLTRERVRQIEVKVISKLKDFIKPFL
jgi:RNA polymerase sigma-32 factor